MAEWLRDLRRCAPSREFESGRVQIFFRFSETVLTNWLISLKCLEIVLHLPPAAPELPQLLPPRPVRPLSFAIGDVAAPELHPQVRVALACGTALTLTGCDCGG
jgi:hypothetical protein